MSLTFREAKYITGRLKGLSKTEAGKAAGFSHWLSHNAGEMIETDAIRQEVARLQQELVANTLEAGLIDATEIHEYLTECLRADMRDIRNQDGSFKPQSEWPEIWGRMMEAGDCEVETSSERSHDGETTDKRGGWDAKGTVTKVKLKFASRSKLLELAMKHKAVNAMVQNADAKEVAGEILSEIDRRVAEGRRRAARSLPEVSGGE